MKKSTIILLLFTAICVSAQNVTNEEFIQTNKKIQELQNENKKLKTFINDMDLKLKHFNMKVIQLTEKTDSTKKALDQATSKLVSQITDTESIANTKIQAVDKSLSINTLLGVIGIFLALLVSGIIYRLLSKRQLSNKSDIEKQLIEAKKSIDEEQIQLSTKLAELYSGQMELLKFERKVNSSSDKIDHSLSLKVADEIVKMQMNLAQMDSKIRGHRQLSIAVTNVFDNFKANGYEIIDYLNKPYKDEMNIDASKEPDASLGEGEMKIIRIIKPEVLFNNKKIQTAQVIVAVGE